MKKESNLCIERKALSALRFHVVAPFYQAARNAAYPEINFDGIYAFAKANGVCAVVPPTDEAALLSSEESFAIKEIFRTAFAASKQCPEEPGCPPEFSGKSAVLNRAMLAVQNIRIAALIRKAGYSTVVTAAPAQMGADRNIVLFEKYGLNLLRTIARAVKDRPESQQPQIPDQPRP